MNENGGLADPSTLLNLGRFFKKVHFYFPKEKQRETAKNEQNGQIAYTPKSRPGGPWFVGQPGTIIKNII